MRYPNRGARKGGAPPPPRKLKCQEFFMFKFAKYIKYIYLN